MPKTPPSTSYEAKWRGKVVLDAPGSRIETFLQNRMKEQIKNRMEVLLQSEIEARTLAKSTAAAAASSKPMSDGSAAAGRASVAESADRRPGAGMREEVKADVVFNVDSGEFTDPGVETFDIKDSL